MKRLACCLIALFVLQPLTAPAASPDRFEKQGATVWVKQEMTRLKKTLALLKRIKDERSAKKGAKALQDMYGKAGTTTAMGEVAPPELPKGEAVAAAVARNAPRLASLEQAIVEETERIEALELKSTELAEALEAMRRVPTIADADYSAPEEPSEPTEEAEESR